MEAARRRQLQAYLQRPLSDLEVELALYDPTTRGPAEVWAKVVGPVRRAICEKWQWCTIRQDARFENDYDLAIAVFAVLAEHLAEVPLNADLVLIAAIVVKRGLDHLCGCP